MDNNYELYNTSDNLVSEMLFKIRDKDSFNCTKFIARCFNLASIEPIRFVARYLVRNVEDASEAKRLLDQYIVVAIYVTLKNKDEKLVSGELSSDYLNDIFNTGLSIDKLSKVPHDDNLFHKLLDTNGNIRSIRNKLFEKIKENHIALNLKSDVYINNLDTILRYRMNFFNGFTQFKYYEKNKRSCDLLIAEARSYKKIREFVFDIPTDNGNYDEFLKNVLKYESDEPSKNELKAYEQNKRDTKIVLAHLVNDAIATNTPLNQVPTISSSELKVFELNYEANLTKSKGGKIKPELMFLSKEENELYYAVLDNINEFKVKYNNELYLISKAGLKKL